MEFDLHGLTLVEAIQAYPEQAAIIMQKQAMELAQQVTPKQNASVCQTIVEDIINFLIRNKYLGLVHVPTLRDEIYKVVSEKINT